MMEDVMVDLETLGTVPGSVILSIGAIAFDEMEVAEEGFYRVINSKSCEEHGLKVNNDTLIWWSNQSDEARKVLTDPDAVFLNHALHDFNLWLAQFPDSVRVWGNGANFDNPLLACAFDIINITPNYRFWNERCYRTVKSQFPDVVLERTGTHHNALDDARTQAEHLVQICQKRDWRLR
jgi:hypothetical protein